MKIELSDEEVLLLHDVLLRAIDGNNMPDCTWSDDCLSCNLFNKFYNLYVEIRQKQVEV